MSEENNTEPDALPHPDSDPPETVAPAPEVEQDPREEIVVPCAGCGTAYSFDVKKSGASFSFVCRKCNTRTEWTRQ